MRIFKKVDQQENTKKINEEIDREVYVKSLQELVKTIEEKNEAVEYYKAKYNMQLSTIKKLRNRIRELESKKRKGSD